MSICAEIIGSLKNDDGTVDLLLGPIGDDGPGQKVLTVVNPPADVETFCKAVAFQKIWGSANTIMVRETVWAKREGYTRIRLVESAAATAESSLPELSDLVGLYEDSPVDVSAGWDDREEIKIVTAKVRFGCKPPDMPIEDDEAESK